MTVHRLETAQRLRAPREKVFPFFSDARNLERITPARLRFPGPHPRPIEMRAGTVIEYRLRLHRIAVGWRTEIVLWDPPPRFVDVQRSGPYRLWHHTHSFEPAGGGTLMRDVVRYALPLGPVAALAHAAFVRRDLERIFDFRGEEVARLLGGMGARA